MPTLEAIILQSGAMTEAQIAAVREEQRLRGGGLDVNILALGYLTEPALQRLLSQLWPHPAEARYNRPPSDEAIALLARQQAAKLRVVPQSLTGHQLTVLVGDTGACEALRELNELADHDLICIATNEVRLCHYLELAYQVECSARYRQIMERLLKHERSAAQRTSSPRDSLIGDPMAGLEPDYLSGAILLKGPSAPAPVPAEEVLDPDVIPLLDEELLIEMDEPEEETVGAVSEEEGTQSLEDGHEELVAQDFQSTLGELSSMEGIPDVFFRFGVPHFKSVAIFKVQSQMILGWKGAGLGMVSGLIRGIVVPMQSDTFLARGIQEGPYVGPAATNPVEERIAEQLGADRTDHVAAAAVTVGERPVLVICGLSNGPPPPSAAVTRELGQLCELASKTVLRLIMERKRAKSTATPSGDPPAEASAEPSAEPSTEPTTPQKKKTPKKKTPKKKAPKKKAPKKKGS